MTFALMTAEERAALKLDVIEQYERLKQAGISLDLTRGKPSDEQLDLADPLLALPTKQYLDSLPGPDPRNYGGITGRPEIRQIFAELLNTSSESVVVQDGSSLAIMYDTISYAMHFGFPSSPRPWNKEAEVKWLCPVPGYDRHFAVTEAFGITMIPVPITSAGPDIDAIEQLVAADPSIKGMWCVPVFDNPGGSIFPEHITARLASMPTAAEDFRVIWDNAYAVHPLTESFPQIQPVHDLATAAGNPDRFIQVASTSKISFAGSGVAALNASHTNLEWFIQHASFRSIGPNKINQLAHAEFFGDADGVRAHMVKQAELLAPRFGAALDVLQQRLGALDIASWSHPTGGYFISLHLKRASATEVVALAKDAGIALTAAGAAFPYGNDPEDNHLRLAPSFPSIEDVKAATSALATCIILASFDQ